MAITVLLSVACARIAERDVARVDCGMPGNGGFEVCWGLVISCRNNCPMSDGTCSGERPDLESARKACNDRCRAPA